MRAEQVGIPAVSFVGELWHQQAVATARHLGMADPPLAVYPGRLTIDDESTFEQKVRDVVVPQIVDGFLESVPKLAAATVEPGPRDIVFEGPLDAIQEHFQEQLWSDGLPIVPPTLARVEAFLRHTSRDPDEVLGVLLPERREGTVWAVAVNGVLAGCRPEYMNLLVAIAEAVSDPEFGLENAGSGVAWEPQITLHGPVIRELGFYHGGALKRIGRQPNTSVARFLRLYMRNVAGLRGVYDTDGIGAGFEVVLAEDEELVRSLGWPTYGEERGLAPGESGVTIQSVAAASPSFGEFGGDLSGVEIWLEPFVEVFGKAILGYWSWTGMAWSNWHPLLLLGPHCARVLAGHGWSKDDVRRYLYENAKIPASAVQRYGDYANLDIPALVRQRRLPADFHESDDPDRLIPTYVRAEWIGIVVAGKANSIWSRGYMNNHEHGPPTTRRIDPPFRR
jgi:hypothetical protein